MFVFFILFSPGDINVKKPGLYPLLWVGACVRARVCVCVCGGGSCQDGVTIQTSTITWYKLHFLVSVSVLAD